MKRAGILLQIIITCLLSGRINGSESNRYKEPLISIPTAGNSWVINDLQLNSKIIKSKGITDWSNQSTIIRT